VFDRVAQVAVERKEKYDAPRTARTFLFGFCVSGPLMHYWYNFLGRTIGGTGLRRGIKVRESVCVLPFALGDG
jgi:hypothetical protein